MSVPRETQSDVDELALARVRSWSLVIHGRGSDRHEWCMAAARALLAHEPIPTFPGRPMPGVPQTRLETIQRLLAAPL